MRENCAAGAKGVGVPGRPKGRALKISHLDLRTIETAEAADAAVRRAVELGFNHLCVGPLFDLGEGSDPFLVSDHARSYSGLAGIGRARDVVGVLRHSCDREGLALFVDVALDRIAKDGASAQALAGIYAPPAGLNVLDPRVSRRDAASAMLRHDETGGAAQWWSECFADLVKAGAGGFRVVGLADLPTGFLAKVVEATRATVDCAFLGWTPGLDWSRHGELADSGVNAVFASTAWWDGKAGWYVDEYERLRRIAPVVGIVEPPLPASNGIDPAPPAAQLRRNLMVAAATTHGLMLPLGLEGDGRRSGLAEDELRDGIVRANRLADQLAAKGIAGEMRPLSGPAGPVSVLLRVDRNDVRDARQGIAMALNSHPMQAHTLPVGTDPLPPTAGRAFVAAKREDSMAHGMLGPDEVAIVDVVPSDPVRFANLRNKRAAAAAAAQSPIAIERITPVVAGGPFAAKHVAGRPFTIEADIFADGHDILAAELQWWAADEKDRISIPLTPVGNDRWRGIVTPRRIGRHHFTIAAWRDEYATLCHALEVKHQAGVDVGVEIAEAAAHLNRLAGDPDLHVVAGTAGTATAGDAVALLTSADVRTRVAAAGQRPFQASVTPLPVEVERPQAEFASWYELFPRSITDHAGRHGTFDDVIATLPRVREMGFDVLYFPPIHPIGATNRKGRNNSLAAGAGDPGSPYAIGSREGGHDAIHPALGTPDDFRRLVAAARDHGLEIALDFAIQCSLDHPWLRDHPDWFRHRPDGSIKYAENPPKKYEDIVNVDFYAEGAIPGLWLALRDVVLHWVGEGVRIFRVDNPHTKPLPFWQWMIADIRGRHPDVIFLSEAFTRPKMMYRLAKVGFSQSYTYFTWRNGKQEITDYLLELTRTDVVDYFRPHFFVNTPDINPIFLQSSGRAGFLIRAALAATLSGLWGVYSGFELCEAAALPGREEYLDSEKYEIRPRNFAQPGNIVAEISTLNRLRKTHPALQSHLGLTFYNAFNDQVLVYGKRELGGHDMILVAVSLDPRQPQEAAFEVPLWEWKLPDDGAVAVEDLMRGDRWTWQGKIQRVRLDPAVLPFSIWRLSSRGAP